MSDQSKNKQPAQSPDIFFRTDHLKSDLKSRSIQGGAITIASQILKFVLQIGGTLFLARLLSPEDFGLIGMVAIILNFVELFKDLGLSTATLQKAEINHAQVSTLFWINVGLSIFISFLVIVLAPSITAFYSEPRLTWIVIALSGNFLLGGLTVQHLALLRRQMHFGIIARIEIASMSVGVAIAIASALLGGSYWALITWRIAQSITIVIGVWLSCRWRPGLPQWNSEIRSMLKFGSNLAAAGILNYFSRNADNFLIGRFWGAQQLGLYAVAYKLLLLPIEQINSPITNVALPTLSRLQNEPEKYTQYYYKALLIITTLGMPIVGFLFIDINKLIPLTLGQQWLDAVPIFQFLIPAAYVGTFNVATGWAFTSLGQADRQLKYVAIASISNVAIFLISVRWGTIGVAAAYGLSRPLFILTGLLYCYHGTALSIGKLAKTLSSPFIASVSAIAVVYSMNQFSVVGTNALVSMAIDLIAYCLVYLGSWLILPNGNTSLKDIIILAKSLKKT